MFCTKCGYNVENASFCPKCGSVINQSSQVQSSVVSDGGAYVMPQQQAPQTPVQPVMQQPIPQTPVQPVMQQQTPQQGDNANLTWNNESQQMWNTYQPTAKKKKSKAPIIIGVVAALVVALVCVGVFLVYPMISGKKKDQEVADVNLTGSTVLKAVTADLKSSASTLASNMSVTKIGSKQKTTGHMTIDKVNLNSEDYLSYVNVDTVNYVVEMDADTGNIYMNINLAKGTSGAPAISMQVYTDGSTLYIKVPELSDKSLKGTVTVETDEEFNKMIKMLSNVDEETMKQYAKVIETLIGHAVSGLDYVIDKAEYSKNEGTITVSAGELGDNSYDSFNVSVNKTDIVEGFNKTIDAIFDDSTIVPYITMLSTVGNTIDKETIKSEFAESLTDVTTFKFVMFTKDDKFAGIRIQQKDYDTEGGEGVIDIVTAGGASLYAGMVVGEEFMKITYDARNEIQKFVINFDASDVYLSFDYQWKQTPTSSEIVKCELSGKSSEFSLALGMSSKVELSAITGLSVSASSFPNAIDVNTATEEQQQAVMTEVQANLMNLITKILSDKALSQMAGSMNPNTTPGGAELETTVPDAA